MKLRCTLMRHGEAAAYHRTGDVGRPLTALGERQAASTAEQLEALGWCASHAFYSAAARTTMTMAMVADRWSVAPEQVSDASLYLGDLRHITALLSPLSVEEVDHVLLLGHNPGWSRAATSWAGLQVRLNVADAALLSTEAESWAEACASDGCWTLEHYISGAVS